MRGFFHGVGYACWIIKEIFVAGFDAVVAAGHHAFAGGVDGGAQHRAVMRLHHRAVVEAHRSVAQGEDRAGDARDLDADEDRDEDDHGRLTTAGEPRRPPARGCPPLRHGQQRRWSHDVSPRRPATTDFSANGQVMYLGPVADAGDPPATDSPWPT